MIKKVSTGILVGILLILMLSATAFAAAVTLILSAQSGLPGDSIEISGKYDPNEWVTVKILDSDGNLVFLKPVRVLEDGTYHTTFIVPDLDAGTLRITAGSGSDVVNASFTVKMKPTPIATPTATPSSTPRPTPTPATTPTAMSTPAASSEPTATNGEQGDVPDTGDDEQEIVPIGAQEGEEAGTVTIEIDVSDLPEGTAAIRLPNGEIVKLDGSGTLLIEVEKTDISEDGSLQLTALDDEGIPLGVYAVQLEQFKTQNTSNAWDDIWAVLMWVLIGIGVLGAAGATLYVIMKKRNRA